jgi:hypothetical protein
MVMSSLNQRGNCFAWVASVLFCLVKYGLIVPLLSTLHCVQYTDTACLILYDVM